MGRCRTAGGGAGAGFADPAAGVVGGLGLWGALRARTCCPGCQPGLEPRSTWVAGQARSDPGGSCADRFLPRRPARRPLRIDRPRSPPRGPRPYRHRRHRRHAAAQRGGAALPVRRGIGRRPCPRAGEDPARLVPRRAADRFRRAGTAAPKRRAASRRALADDRPAEGAARPPQPARLRLRAVAVGARRAGHRLRARRDEGRGAAAPGGDLALPGRAVAPRRARGDPRARERPAPGRRAGRARGRRPGSDRTRRLGRLPGDRCCPPDEHLRVARDHVRVVRRRAGGRGLAAQRAPVPGGAGAACGAVRRAGAGIGLCLVQRLGRAGATHGLDAGHGGPAACQQPRSGPGPGCGCSRARWW